MKLLVVIATCLVVTVASSAFAQPASPTPQATSPAPERAARFLIERGTGQGRVEIKCAEADSTRACLDAVLPVLTQDVGGGQPGVAYATSSIKCGNTVYEVSTGTKGGKCTTQISPPGSSSGPANDILHGRGKLRGRALQYSCLGSTNSGSCTIKSAP